MFTELRPDKTLLDSNFNGYKLSLDPIPVYHHTIDQGVDHISQSEDQYSFVHSKVFSLHNHLFGDPSGKNTVFLIDKTWKVLKASINPNTSRISALEVVWTIPNLERRQDGHFNCSISFPAPQTAALSDGCGRLHLLGRPDIGLWNLELSHEVPPSVLECSCIDNEGHLHCVLMNLEMADNDSVSSPPDSNKPKLATVNSVLHWLTFTRGVAGWKEVCARKLEGPGSIDYVALEISGKALYVACSAKVKFTLDTANPLPPPQEEMDVPEEKAKYSWTQTEDDINVRVQLEEGVTRDDIEVKVTDKGLNIRCQQKTVVAGPLSFPVDTDFTTWTLNPHRLEVILVKRDSGQMWSELVLGDKGGDHVVHPQVVQDVHSRLSHLCSDTEVQEVGESYAPTFNLDQLEECDSNPEDFSCLVRLDPSTHSISHQISLTGHQWLMAIPQGSDRPSCLCVRHDVDGCVWRPDVPDDSGEWPCQHIATFFALGYVAASKQQKKFMLAAPDLSYAVICEASNHVFVYHKSCTVNGELRNRKASSRVHTMAKQQLINLQSRSPVLGACAADAYLFVLTADTLYLYDMQ